MAAANLVQRGLQSLNQQMRQQEARRSGEGEGKATGAGKSKKGGRARRAKDADSKKGLGGALGLAGAGYVDAWEEDDEQRQRRRKARWLIGDDEEMIFIAKDGEHRDLAATVAPEFRAQVASGLARANTLTVGSTLVDGGGAGGEGDDAW
jgi:hypothetical protein